MNIFVVVFTFMFLFIHLTIECDRIKPCNDISYFQITLVSSTTLLLICKCIQAITMKYTST